MKSDLAHAWRTTRRRPGFALAVVLTLGVGIGATSAGFGLVDAVVLSPLPYEDSHELFGIIERHTSGQLRVPSYPSFLDLGERSEVFEELAYARGAPITFQGEVHSGLLLGAFVTEGFFELLGVPAIFGRTLTADDYRPEAEAAVLLSHRAWTRYFGSDPGVLGATLVVGGSPFTVVGVMPPSFAYPDWGADNDMWMPLSHLPASEAQALHQRGFGADSRVVARLAPGVDPSAAGRTMESFSSAQAAAYPETNAGWAAAIEPLGELEVRGVEARLFMLWGATLLVLAMCCLNLSNLYLVQGSQRSHEYALRAALGASRGRVFRQVVTETLLLSLGGGLLGVAVAQGCLAWARRGGLADLPRITEVALDARVVLFAGALSVAIALLFARLAARRAGEASLQRELRDGRGGIGWSAPLLSGIQAAQVGMTFVMLLGAWLLGETFLRLTRVEPGYEPSGLLVVPVNPPTPAYDGEADAVALYSGLLERIEAVPGVRSVALTNHGPGGLAGLPTSAAAGRAPEDPERDLSVFYRTISAGYFGTVGTPLVAGREFTQADLLGPEGPVVVSESLAAHLGGNTSAVGRTLGVRKAASTRADFGEPLLGAVVGVAADLAPSETGGRVPLVVYVPFTHSPWAQVRLLVRARDTSPETVAAIEDGIRSLEPRIPLDGPFVGVQRMEDLRSAQRSRERLNATLTTAFATVALLLALVGTYGVTSFIVTLRTREVGVRLALGATPRRVAAGVIERAALVAATGLAGGAAVAMAASSSISGFLFGVSPLSVERYLVIAAVLSGLTALAAYVPARRASRVDPATTLRAD